MLTDAAACSDEHMALLSYFQLAGREEQDPRLLGRKKLYSSSEPTSHFRLEETDLENHC